MEIFICKICQKECNGINGLKTHNVLIHKLNSEETYVEYILNGINPKCECGCGGTPPFITCVKGYSRFIQSHHNRVVGKNNFHKNPESKIKSAKTQSENWNKGMYRRWWEEDTEDTKNKIEGIKEKLRNDKVRGKKISDKLLGISKTDESKIKISITQKERYKNNPQLIKDLSNGRIKWLKRKGKKGKTKIESKFESILILLNLEFNYQYEFEHNFYDYYLPTKKIIIEVDGDFYHCNPSKFKEPIYETQKLTIKNDNKKNNICKNYNITLLRYWEKDINERPEWVIQDLKEKIFTLI